MEVFGGASAVAVSSAIASGERIAMLREIARRRGGWFAFMDEEVL
jgi:hypothetical protein